MLPTTLQIVKSGLQADPSLTPTDRARLLAVLRNGATPHGKPETPPGGTARLLRRAEVARRLAISTRTVDKLPLRKIRLPGRIRAAGFLEGDVNELLAGKGAA